MIPWTREEAVAQAGAAGFDRIPDCDHNGIRESAANRLLGALRMH